MISMTIEDLVQARAMAGIEGHVQHMYTHCEIHPSMVRRRGVCSRSSLFLSHTQIKPTPIVGCVCLTSKCLYSLSFRSYH